MQWITAKPCDRRVEKLSNFFFQKYNIEQISVSCFSDSTESH